MNLDISKSLVHLIGLVLCGCEEPPDLSRSRRQGRLSPKISPDAEPAQALGEAAPTA